MKVNLHTHTLYCDGTDRPEELIQAAISAGFDILGFSGHSYTSYDESYCMSREETEDYVREIRSLAAKYKDKITIWCGLEKDFFADDDADSEVFDYAIGSVHAFFKEHDMTNLQDLLTEMPEGIIPVPPDTEETRGGYYIYADWTAQPMKWAITHLYGGDAMALAEDYFAHEAQLADMADVKIIGHLDLLTKFEERLAAEGQAPLFDVNHPRYTHAARTAIEKLAAAGKIFEINTGGMAKGYRTAPYPSLPLLKIIHEAGGKIMINSDCHAADKLDFGYELALKLAKEAGFQMLTIPMPDGSQMEVEI